MDKLMLSILGGVAVERSIIRERQREGIAVAKGKEAYRGRKRALTAEQVTAIRQRAAAGEHKAALAREFNVSRDAASVVMTHLRCVALLYIPMGDSSGKAQRTPGRMPGYQVALFPLITSVLKSMPQHEQVQFFFEEQDVFACQRESC